jgi:predicted small metal-binding protein
MAKNPGTPIGAGPNPDMNSEDGHINPSAPSAGTEGWGMTSDEQRVLGSNDPEHTRKGQMKGNPGDHMAAASQRASDAATTNKPPADSNNQSDLSQRTSGSANSMNNSQGGYTQGGMHTFRCADAGHADCAWETSGRSEEEVLQKVVAHARDDHGMTDWSDAMHDRIRGAIQHRKAA